MEKTKGYLQSHQTRTTYLITYSEANAEIISTTERFENAVKDSFNQGTKFSRVFQWACSKEKQSNGGTNYHFALKRKDFYRQVQLKEQITDIMALR